MHASVQAQEIFRCERLSKRFGAQQVLTDVEFSVNAGEILGVIGPNGAGKTTLMECLTGLLPSESVSLSWQGVELSPFEAKQYLYYMPDGILPYPDQPVTRVLRFFQQLYRADDHRYNTLLQQLALGPVLEQRCQALSKGYKRRLLLAIGLLSSQPLLLLDEPFDGFDLRQTLSIMALLRGTLTSRALLLSIHQLAEAEKICDRFLLLNGGQVAGLGTLEQLRCQAGLVTGGLEEVFLAIV